MHKYLLVTTCLLALTVRAQAEGPKVEYVDLGVSVKWATCNLGASKPEDFGDYYAWGEAEPYYVSLSDKTWKDSKSDGYKWSSYSWCQDGEYTALTKYNTVEKYGPVDNKTALEEADDAARVLLGGSGRIPTDAEWSELIAQCKWEMVTQNEMPGYRVSSKTNRNSIFLPAAGYRSGRSFNGDETGGYYWSSSLNTDLPNTAWRIFFNSGGVCRCNLARCVGISIRPVAE